MVTFEESAGRAASRNDIHRCERLTDPVQDDRCTGRQPVRSVNAAASFGLAPPRGSMSMSKAQKGNKEAKKQPLLNAKEKKAAKQVKKHAGDVVPMLPPRAN